MAKATTPERQRKDKQARYRRDREKVLARAKTYYENNKEYVREYKRQYQIKNKQRLNQTTAAYKAAHPDYMKTYLLQHYQNNKIEYKLRARQRLSHIRRATPTWAQQDAIAALYVAADDLTDSTGVRHSVDHVIPLRGKLVSGLHVAENMRVITLSKNCAKGNKYEPR